MRRMMLSALALLVMFTAVFAQPEDVSKDIKEVDDRADKPFEQIERENAMRRLGASGDAAGFEKLVELLNDPFVHIRASAQRILVEAKADPAPVLIDKGLGHKQPEVRRRSALALGRRNAVDAPKTLRTLLKGDRDEAVRAAAAKALGSIAAKQGDGWKERDDVLKDLEKALKKGDASAGAAALELGKLNAPDVADKIAGVLKAKTPAAVVGACDGLVALHACADHADDLAKAAGSKDWRVRIAAVQAMCSVEQIPDEDRYREVLGKALDDKDWRVRRRGIEALVDLWQKLSVELLVARLPDEDGALALDIVHALEDLTGVRQGYLKEAWTRWYEGTGKDRPLADRKPRPENGWLRAPKPGSVEAGGGGATASYFDIPVYAQASAFVFDMSGSMRDPVGRDNPKIRVELARDELAKTLSDLPENTPFNLLIYRYYSEFPIRTEIQQAFSKGVQPLTDRNRDAANKWIEGQPAKGWGAFYEGLMAAFSDPEVQVVYFMSDGAPSRGEYVDRIELVEALAEARRFSPVVVHGVLVGGGRRDEEFMKSMAESCGGTFADARNRK